MSTLTLALIVGFALAILLENALVLTFLHRLRTRHPRQWLQSRQPLRWQGQVLQGAYTTMRYVKDYAFLGSADQEGIRYCDRSRPLLLLAYWSTALAGVALVVALAVSGW